MSNYDKALRMERQIMHHERVLRAAYKCKNFDLAKQIEKVLRQANNKLDAFLHQLNVAGLLDF